MQARETVVVNAADAIVAQHSRTERCEDEFTQINHALWPNLIGF